MISVIIPNYNGGKTVLETVRSVQAQDLPLEIILIDDISTDSSADEVEKAFGDVRVIRLKEKGFATGARNEGILNSTGDSVLFIDNDARLEKGALKSMAGRLKNADIVFPKIMFDNGTMMYPRIKEDESYPSISAVFLMKKSALAKLDAYFDENYGIYFEDTDFFQRCKLFGLKAAYADDAIARHVLKAAGNKERQYFLYVRNYLYGYLKFFGVKDDPFKGLVRFLSIKLFVNGFLNYAWQERYHSEPAGSKLDLLRRHEKLTERNRLVLFYLFFKAIFWNLKNLRNTLAERRKFLEALRVST